MITNIITHGVRIEWTVNDEQYPYQDTLYLSNEDYERLWLEGIKEIQEVKYNEWKSYILNPQG
jgi:hypothetical protein